MMKLYVVVRTGVNDRGTVGIYDSMYKAKKAMNSAKMDELDNYHSFEIRERELNYTTILEQGYC